MIMYAENYIIKNLHSVFKWILNQTIITGLKMRPLHEKQGQQKNALNILIQNNIFLWVTIHLYIVDLILTSVV
jgi:hypothetical protein